MELKKIKVLWSFLYRHFQKVQNLGNLSSTIWGSIILWNINMCDPKVIGYWNYLKIFQIFSNIYDGIEILLLELGIHLPITWFLLFLLLLVQFLVVYIHMVICKRKTFYSILFYSKLFCIETYREDRTEEGRRKKCSSELCENQSVIWTNPITGGMHSWLTVSLEETCNRHRWDRSSRQLGNYPRRFIVGVFLWSTDFLDDKSCYKITIASAIWLCFNCTCDRDFITRFII